MVKVRVACASDLDEIADLWLQLAKTHEKLDPRFALIPHPEVVWREQISKAMGDPDHRVLVAVEKKQIVGFAYGSVGMRPPFFTNRLHGNINDIYVAEPHRRCGIGTKLINSLIRWFEDKGIHTVQTQYYAGNPEAKAFWENTGFETSMHKAVHTTPT